MSSQKRAENGADNAEHERQFHECLEKLEALESKVCSAHGETVQSLSEVSAAYQQLLQERHGSQEEIRQIGTEFRAMCDSVEQDRAESRKARASIQEHLQRLASGLAEAAGQSSSPRDEELAQVLEATRQQQVAWQEDRAQLQAELEAERQRTAQQSEALADQHHLAAQQQAELAGELKRMRSLLDIILNHMNQPSNTTAGNQTSSTEDSAVAAVLAQFEMLQRELAQRRTGRQESAAKGGSAGRG